MVLIACFFVAKFSVQAKQANILTLCF